MGLRKRTLLIFSVLLLSGLVLRVPYLIKYHKAINMDEAVIGIMAQDILRGEFPLFYYGQSYIGPIEAFFTAPFFYIFSENTIVLRISILILTLLSLVLFWRGFCMIAKPPWPAFWGVAPPNVKTGLSDTKSYFRARGHHGLMAFGWLILSPTVLTIFSIHPWGHMGGLFAGSLIFFFAAWIIRGGKTGGMALFGYGMAVGLGLWMHPESLVYSLASGLIVLGHNLRVLRGIPASLLGCLTGGLPFWIRTFQLKLGTVQFGQDQGSRQTLGALLKDMGQSVIHMNGFLGYDLLPYGIGMIIWGLIMAVLAAGFIGLIRRREASGAKLILVFAWTVILLTFFAYAYINASRFGFVSYRYYFPILIGLAFILDFALTSLIKRFNRAALFLCVALLAVNLWTNALALKNEAYSRYEVHLEKPFLAWQELMPVLPAHKIDRAYVDFFAEAPLNFTSREKIVSADFCNSRYPRAALMVESAINPAFILADTEEAGRFRQGLDFLNSQGYSSLRTPSYKIFYSIKPPDSFYTPIDRRDMRIQAYPNPDTVSALLDDNMATTWSTGENQKGNEYILLDLGRTVDLARVDLISKWHDLLPVHIIMETSLDNHTWVQAVDAPTASTLYWAGEHPVYKVLEGFNQYIFPERRCRYLRIKQVGVHRNSWILAEIYLYAQGEKRERLGSLDWERLMTFLKERGIKKVLSDLWGSANIIRRSTGQIAANVRYNEVTPGDDRGKLEFSAGEIPALLVHQRDGAQVFGFLKEQGWRFQTEKVGDYSLIHQLQSPLNFMKSLDTQTMAVTASHNQKEAALLSDPNRKKDWQSLAPRSPGMFIRCDLKKAQGLSAIILDPGKHPLDTANTLKLYCSSDGLNWNEIPMAVRLHTKLRWTGSHLLGSGSSSAYLFPPVKARFVKMVCLDKDKDRYWSVGKLSILGPGK